MKIVAENMEFGEVDSSSQFRSVKDAISMFNRGVFMEKEKSRTCLPERIMTEGSKQYLTDTRLYFDGEEERKLAEDINLKLLSSRVSGKFPELTDFIRDESFLKNALKFLKMELAGLKKEHSKLMLEESLTGSVFFDLKAQKLELDSCIAEEFAASGHFDGLVTVLRDMLLETRDARKEEEREMKFMTEELKKQTEAASSSLSQIENELRLALQETEEAKSSEARIRERIRVLSGKSIPSSMDSAPESITIPEEEFEYLIQRIYKADVITEMKVAAARKQIEEAKASEHKALKELKRRRKQVKDMQVILDFASKRAEHKQAHKKSDSQTSCSRPETQAYHPIKTSKHKLIAREIKIKEQCIAGGGHLPRSHCHCN